LYSRLDSIKQRATDIAAISLAFLFAAVSYLAVTSLVTASDDLKSSHDVLSRVSEIEKLSITLETARRGYMITQHRDYISEIELSQEVLLVIIRETRAIIEGDTKQAAGLDRLENLVHRVWNQSAMAKTHASRLQATNVATSDIARLAENAIIIEMDNEINAFHTAETSLLFLREQEWEYQSGLTTAIVAIGTLLLIGFAGFQMHMTKNLRRETAELEDERHKMQGRDWVKSNLAALSRNLQNIKSPEMFAATIMNKLVPLLDGHVGMFYSERKEDDDRSTLMMIGTYAFQEPEGFSPRVEFGQGLIGQCALEGVRRHINWNS
jgi:CHASE3 domain sensor protein